MQCHSDNEQREHERVIAGYDLIGGSVFQAQERILLGIDTVSPARTHARTGKSWKEFLMHLERVGMHAIVLA